MRASPGKPSGAKPGAEGGDGVSDVSDVDIDDWELDSTNASGLSVTSPPPPSPPLSNFPTSNGGDSPRDEDAAEVVGADEESPWDESAGLTRGMNPLTPRALQVLSMSTPDDSVGGPPSWCTASEPPSSVDHELLDATPNELVLSQMHVLSEEEGDGAREGEEREEEGGLIVVPEVVVGGTGLLVDRREQEKEEGGNASP